MLQSCRFACLLLTWQGGLQLHLIDDVKYPEFGMAGLVVLW
jgi:hypothetical protein